MKSISSNILGLLFVLAALTVAGCSRQEPALPTAPPPPAPPTPRINEVYSRGTTTAPDWIEIYNRSSSQMDLSGYKIYDSGGQSGTKPKRVLPAGTVVTAYGYLVIVVDDTTATGFGLSSSGETVWFENASGTIIDSIAFPALGVDTAYARKPDGATTWEKTTPPSPGLTNSTGGTVLPVVMNEIYSRGVATDPDWIELYNPSTVSIDISGYKIYDVGGQGGTKPKKAFPAGTIISAHGYFVIVTDDTTSSGFGLSSAGEQVWLEDAAGAIIDNVTFTAMDVTQSYGRLPDGSATWQLLTTITRGAANRQ